eukprot:TRINITY_DN1208_c0_g1_i9.p4 TRINITY_DN1208_c0_g1~~TRINITY_DN1208_c0_g1_i9.p4  ORF type:complete len:101 (+),score=1.49 TRINITY_DN1208_c0_g1_i9:469-771(+)
MDIQENREHANDSSPGGIEKRESSKLFAADKILFFRFINRASYFRKQLFACVYRCFEQNRSDVQRIFFAFCMIPQNSITIHLLDKAHTQYKGVFKFYSSH